MRQRTEHDGALEHNLERLGVGRTNLQLGFDGVDATVKEINGALERLQILVHHLLHAQPIHHYKSES